MPSLHASVLNALGKLLEWPWLETLGVIVSALAWPVVVLVVILVLRTQVSNLLSALVPHMRKLQKVTMPGGFSAEWWKDLEEIEDRLVGLQGPGEETTSTSGVATGEESADSGAFEERPDLKPNLDSYPDIQGADGASEGEAQGAGLLPFDMWKVRRIAEISPPLAVVEAFMFVEKAVESYVRLLGLPWNRTPLNSFRVAPEVPEALKNLVQDMAFLRNQAAHNRSDDLSVSGAVKYAKLAAHLVLDIEEDMISKETGRSPH